MIITKLTRCLIQNLKMLILIILIAEIEIMKLTLQGVWANHSFHARVIKIRLKETQ